MIGYALQYVPFLVLHRKHPAPVYYNNSTVFTMTMTISANITLSWRFLLREKSSELHFPVDLAVSNVFFHFPATPNTLPFPKTSVQLFSPADRRFGGCLPAPSELKPIHTKGFSHSANRLSGTMATSSNPRYSTYVVLI